MLYHTPRCYLCTTAMSTLSLQPALKNRTGRSYRKSWASRVTLPTKPGPPQASPSRPHGVHGAARPGPAAVETVGQGQGQGLGLELGQRVQRRLSLMHVQPSALSLSQAR